MYKTPFELQLDAKTIFLDEYLKAQEQKKKALEKDYDSAKSYNHALSDCIALLKKEKV